MIDIVAKLYAAVGTRSILAIAILSLSGACTGVRTEARLESRIERMESGLRPAFRSHEDPGSSWSITERMRHYRVPGVSLAIIQNGRIVYAKGYGVTRANSADPIDTSTLFSVGSLSKVVAALVTLKLQDAGRIDIDKDVNEYLSRWRVPAYSGTSTEVVTLRQILSHTSGLSITGFDDYLPTEELPSLLQTLDGIRPAKNEAVKMISPPGAFAIYSGGGTTVLELLLEDVTGDNFSQLATRTLFRPLGLKRTTFDSPLAVEAAEVAHAHDSEGRRVATPRGWHSFPERAASGLWTTPTEYAELMLALWKSYHGSPNAILPRELAVEALTEVGPSPYGLGPRLFGLGADRRFGHTGSNESYQARFELRLRDGAGLVIFTNGERGEALYEEIFRAFSDAFDWRYEPNFPIHAVPMANIEACRFEGTYTADVPDLPSARRGLYKLPRTLRVWREGANLKLAAETNGTTSVSRSTLHRLGPNVYVDDQNYRVFEFISSASGSALGMVIMNGRHAAHFQRLDGDRQTTLGDR